MSTKRIQVKFETGCRFVDVDFDSIERTREAVKKKWGLDDSFILRSPPGEKVEQQMDIVDDDDLQHFRDATTLHVHMLIDTMSCGAASFLSERAQGVEGPPPPYEQSQHVSQIREQKAHSVELPVEQSHLPKDGQPTRERRMSVSFEGATASKRVSIDMGSLQNTKYAIRQKLGIPTDEDFDLLGKLRNENKSFDIEGDNDLEDIVDADHLIVRRKSDSPDKPSEPKDGEVKPARERKVSVTFEDTLKLVKVNLDSLESSKKAIREKIPIDGDFRLQGKLKNEENCFDIEDDNDLDDIDEAEYLIVTRKSDKDHPLPSEQNVEAGAKEVRIAFNDNTTTIQTDMRSLEKIKHSIAQAFRIEGDFEIVARRLGTDDYPPYHNIQNDTDLFDLDDAVEFVVQQTTLSQEQMPSTMYAFPVQEHASFPSVALHASNAQPWTEPSSSSDPAMDVGPTETQATPLPQVSTKSKRKYRVKCGERCKTITVDFDKSVDDIRKRLGQKFSIQDDFRLLAIKANGEDVDIDDDDDFDDLEEALELAVKLKDIPADTDNQKEMDVIYTPGAALECATRQDQDVRTYANQEQAKKTMVQYRGEEYSVLVPPETQSNIVEEQERDLAGNFNVSNILDQLDSTADCLRLAYLGTLGDKELHKVITDMQFDVLRLGKLCDDTIVEFRIKSGSIIEDLEAGFTFLFEGHDQFALSNFRSIGGTSKEMLETTKRLKHQFDVKAKQISDTLARVVARLEGVSEPLPILSSDAEANLEKRIKEAEKATDEMDKKCKELEAEIADTKETFVGEGYSEEDVFKWIEQGFVKDSDLQNIAKGNSEMLENIAKEGRLRTLEKAEEARNAEIRANKEMAELVKQMKRLNPSDDKEGIFAMALRGAETGVKNLQASLEAVASFWKTLAVQCQYITGDKIASVLERACSDTDRDKENPFWSLTPFKLKVVRFYAKWVAVRKTCDKFHNGMEKVEKGIHLCLRDNPNVREARERMPKLMNEFNQKTEDRTQSIERQNAIAAAEKKEIQRAIKPGP